MASVRSYPWIVGEGSGEASGDTVARSSFIGLRLDAPRPAATHFLRVEKVHPVPLYESH